MGGPGLPDPAVARRSLIPLLGLVVQGHRPHYTAETETQAREAFQIACQIADKAKAPFRLLPNALEVRARESGGVMSFGWRVPDEIGDLIDTG